MGREIAFSVRFAPGASSSANRWHSCVACRFGRWCAWRHACRGPLIPASG